ncbi:MAG: Xylose operon regulatory protein [Pseudomonadota bacterium]
MVLELVNQCESPGAPGVFDTAPARRVRTDAPRVLAILNMSTGWSRGVLRGFMAFAHERGWMVLHYPPPVDLPRLVQKFAPAAALIGPASGLAAREHLRAVPLVSVALDLSAEGIASVCPDERQVGVLALEHLLATGLRQVSTFRLDSSPFGVAREQAFVEAARAAGVRVAVGWGSEEAPPSWRGEDPEGLVGWLQALPKPCGIFACADHLARIVARYIRLAGLRVPEDIALLGVDNDVVECELLTPPLSSVMIPWQELGRRAAQLVEVSLSGRSIKGQRLLSSPISVMARRSSELLAIDDVTVADAVRWIRAHACERVTVPMVAHAVGGGRQGLERRFRRVLDRSVQQEVRRVRVELAKVLLRTTRADLVEVAKRSGFTTAALLNVAFQRELGMPPGVYRRRVQQALVSVGDD